MNVTVLSWGATAVVAALTAAALWMSRPTPPPAPVEAASPEAPLPEPELPQEKVPLPAPNIPPWAARETDGPEERLERLGMRLIDALNRRGRWPADTPAERPDEPPRSFFVELQQPADDAGRRALVREFLNPLLAETTTPQGDGVTHFVGVAGVGEDGPRLPVDHPRAGIFGAGRHTRKEDVADGLSHTLLLLGVEANLGSWAAAGPATVRPLTQEPYLRGPDGFGTGQDDGMFVLMADGSVKFLSSETHPILMRRMAAMADGLPLDLSVPGDPTPAVVAVEPLDTAPLPPADLPAPEEPPEPVDTKPKIDLNAALAQRLLRFRQGRSVPRRELLDLVEEMLGAPIRYDRASLGEAAEALEQAITLDLQDVTVEDVLRRVLDQSDLTYEREGDGVRLRRKGAPAPHN
jgi:hypothetical protein